MEIKYQILYQEHVISKHIPELPSDMKPLVKRAIEERLTVDPIGLGKPLQYSLKGHRRLRVGNYRVIYRIEKNTVIIIYLTKS
jgi:addiction module RelE/StbE family toxin